MYSFFSRGTANRIMKSYYLSVRQAVGAIVYRIYLYQINLLRETYNLNNHLIIK